MVVVLMPRGAQQRSLTKLALLVEQSLQEHLGELLSYLASIVRMKGATDLQPTYLREVMVEAEQKLKTYCLSVVEVELAERLGGRSSAQGVFVW